MAEEALEAFAQTLVADVQGQAEADGTTTPEAFTRVAFELLEESGYTANTATAYHKSFGHEVHGYGFRDGDGTLDLFTTDFSSSPLESKLMKPAITTMFKRLLGFVKRGPQLVNQVDESFDVHDMCVKVNKAVVDAVQIRLFVLSNRIGTTSEFPSVEFEGIPVVHEVWDLARLYRLKSSGSIAEPISVTFDPPLPCVAAPSAEADHSVVLAVIPGRLLADLYDRYDTRILELNVRSFLQIRVAVNKGIRHTLLHSPERFLAYNNGITVTASEVQFIESAGGVPTYIASVQGIQVVNGGQTTASLHHVLTKDKNPLTGVQVQMKLTQVAPDQLKVIVPKISEYSNSQNRVTLLDFSSNHAFHVDFQRISRQLLAPGKKGGRETRWFYERARGQYTDGLSKARTPARQKAFKADFPASQKFNKADLAKYIHSWTHYPYYVSRGAQKNFGEFMVRLEQSRPQLDARYVRRVIAMGILFKAVDKIAAVHQAGNIKSFVTTYTMARISSATDQRIDLDLIWQDQVISEALEAAIDDLCPRVMAVITNPEGALVSEWAKKDACWKRVSALRWQVPKNLAAELRQDPIDDAVLLGDGHVGVGGDKEEYVDITAEEWLAITYWGRDTGRLTLPQRQLVLRMAKKLESGEIPSTQLAEQAYEVRDEALRSGFTP